MVGPFRFAPPEIPPGAVIRPRLLESMAARRRCRLVTVVAGPGFAKTTALAMAMKDTSSDSELNDVWLSCEPDDDDAQVLIGDLGRSLGLDHARSFDDIARAIWMVAPVRVCLILDDVHQIPADSPGADLVARLVAELPRNAGVVLASRSAVPVSAERLAGQGQLHRITENDLLMNDSEIESFASVRGVDPAVVAASGGWPALAELIAAASSDLVVDYVWDQVLSTLGTDRTRDIARMVVVGGGGDDIVAAVSPGVPSARALVAGVPLIEFGRDGSVTPHPLWDPVVRDRLDPGEIRRVQIEAARCHRSAERFDRAVGLFAMAEHWEELLATVRLAALDLGTFDGWHRYGAWYRLLPAEWRSDPVARLAAGIDMAARVPTEAEAAFAQATAGFRAAGDAEAEMVSIERHGVVKWWANDVGGLFELYQRAVELSAEGLARAIRLTRIGDAAIAHLTGDPHGVLSALEHVEATGSTWAPSIVWFRHVAYRRLGDLGRAESVFDIASGLPGIDDDPQHALAKLRTDWLRGDVDHVATEMRTIADHYDVARNRYLHVETAVECAAHLAWLGDRVEATRLLTDIEPWIDAVPGALVRVLHTIAEAALAVDAGDDARAREILTAEPLARPGLAESWYWFDRTAVALPHQLLPDDRDGWARAAERTVHKPGLMLSEALTLVRNGDLDSIASLVWPTPGRARAHLPARWLAELVAAGEAVGNPAPIELIDSISATGTAVWRALSARTASAEYARGADRLAARFDPHRAVVDIRAMGPIEVLIDGEHADHPHLRRRRVRELLCRLLLGGEQRRDMLADALWPDHNDPRQNLRVTLSYLRTVLEPDHDHDHDQVNMIATHETVRLVPSRWLRCDVWDLDRALEAAGEAERRSDPGAALEAYRRALPLWAGEPFADLPEHDWLRDERSRRTARFVSAAIRAGELMLADGDAAGARHAAALAVGADKHDEHAHCLLVRAHLGNEDMLNARRAIETCMRALDEIGVAPAPLTVELSEAVMLNAERR